MFSVDPSELALLAFVALLVIGPKDLPKAMRVVGYWVGKGRGMMRQMRAGFDTMMREAELKELEEKWAAENARIMREHPAEPQVLPQGAADPAQSAGAGADGDAPPAFTPPPVISGPLPPSNDEIEAALGIAPPGPAHP